MTDKTHEDKLAACAQQYPEQLDKATAWYKLLAEVHRSFDEALIKLPPADQQGAAVEQLALDFGAVDPHDEINWGDMAIGFLLALGVPPAHSHLALEIVMRRMDTIDSVPEDVPYDNG